MNIEAEEDIRNASQRVGAKRKHSDVDSPSSPSEPFMAVVSRLVSPNANTYASSVSPKGSTLSLSAIPSPLSEYDPAAPSALFNLNALPPAGQGVFDDTFSPLFDGRSEFSVEGPDNFLSDYYAMLLDGM